MQDILRAVNDAQQLARKAQGDVLQLRESVQHQEEKFSESESAAERIRDNVQRLRETLQQHERTLSEERVAVNGVQDDVQQLRGSLQQQAYIFIQAMSAIVPAQPAQSAANDRHQRLML